MRRNNVDGDTLAGPWRHRAFARSLNHSSFLSSHSYWRYIGYYYSQHLTLLRGGIVHGRAS